MWNSFNVDHLLNRLSIQPMKELTFNQWQEHLAKELEKNYCKLKLIKDEKLQAVPSKQPKRLYRV
jgi:hypothetical protein